MKAIYSPFLPALGVWLGGGWAGGQALGGDPQQVRYSLLLLLLAGHREVDALEGGRRRQHGVRGREVPRHRGAAGHLALGPGGRRGGGGEVSGVTGGWRQGQAGHGLASLASCAQQSFPISK